MYNLNLFKDKKYSEGLKLLFENSSYELTTNKRKLKDFYYRDFHKNLSEVEIAHDNFLDEAYMFAINEDNEPLLAYYSDTYGKLFIIEMDTESSLHIVGDSPVNFINKVIGILPRPNKRNFIKYCTQLGINYHDVKKIDYRKDPILKKII